MLTNPAEIYLVLQMLGVGQFIDEEENRKYILSTQQDYTGGFSKWSDTIPDPLHTYFGIIFKKTSKRIYFSINFVSGLCGLALMKEPGLKEINYALNMSVAAADHLKKLHKRSS